MLLFCALCTPLALLGQSFLAEWTASSNGGIAPVGLALTTESGVTYLYAADAPRGRILKFNTATGAVAAVIGSAGAGLGQFNQPYGIAVHAASGDLYVAERGNHRVQRVTNTGGVVMSWGTQGAGPGQFNEPIGVAVDAAGNVYVTDLGNARVQKFQVAQSGGAWTATSLADWGSPGSGTGQFNRPYGIAVDAAGNVWVADGINGRIQKFNSSGAFQSVVGGPGADPGQFIVATWVGFDAAGNLLVSSTNSDPTNGALPDAASQWVSRFTSGGAYVSRWGGAFGSGPGQFRLPFATVAGPDNRAYVADFYNNRIQVFDLAGGGGTTPPPPPTPSTPVGPEITSFTLGPDPTPTSASFVVTFNEPVTGVDAADFAINGTGTATATITGVTQGATAASYTVAFNYTGTGGSIQMAIRTAGTGITGASGAFAGRGIAASAPVTVNNAPPADSAAPAVASLTAGTASGSTVNFTLTFNEPVTGVEAADFLLTRGGTVTATLGTITADAAGTVYTIPVSFTGEGTVQLTAIGGATTNIRDAATHWFAGGAAATAIFSTSGSGPDVTPPAVASFTTGPATPSSVAFALTFSEPVTGVDAADFSVATTGGATATIGAVTGSAASYTIPVTFVGTGTVQLSLNATASGIADAAGNALATGASGPVFTLGSSGGGGTTGESRIVAITPPANGSYRKGQELIFVVQFDRAVTISPDPRPSDDDDADDVGVFFTWTAVGSTDPKRDSGKVHYRSGSGTTTLTFRYKVRNGDFAPNGIQLGSVLQPDDGTSLRDASGALTAQQITLPWAQNPLTGVILDAPKLNNGHHGNGNSGKPSAPPASQATPPAPNPQTPTPNPTPNPSSGGSGSGSENQGKGSDAKDDKGKDDKDKDKDGDKASKPAKPKS